jgi:hypothetical protein
MKTLVYFVFALFFIACASEVNKVEIEVLKDGIADLKLRNHGCVLTLERNLFKSGSQSDVILIDSAKQLIYNRDAALRNKITMSAYGSYLFEKYATSEMADSSRLSRAKILLYNYIETSDSLQYHQLLLSLLLIERDLIEAEMMNYRGDVKCFGFHIPIYADQDTIKIGSSFSFIACGFEKLRGTSVLEIHNKFTVKLNGVTENIPVDYKIIGNAVVVTVKPDKAGEYFVFGGIGIFDKNLIYEASDTFRQRIYVTE